MSKKYVLGVILDIHAHMGGKTCDYFFDVSSDYGIHGAEVMKPLANARNFQFNYNYDEDSTLATLSEEIENIIKLEKLYYWVKIGFLYKDDYYGFSHKTSTNLKYILGKYFDNTQEITISISISCDAGEVYSDRKLLYYTHSREAGRHNEPHIHVIDSGHNYEASISIITGELLAGYLPSKMRRMAKNTILNNLPLFAKAWNTSTDGLFLDINKCLESSKK